jgi:ribosomal protein L11 methyltransferase
VNTLASRRLQRRDIGGQRWLEISLTVDSETAEAVAETLGRISPAGVAIEPVEPVSDADFPATESAPAPAQSGKLQLRSFLEVDGNLEHSVRQLERALWPLEMIARESGLIPPTPQYRPIADTDWMAQWKSRYRPLRVGRRLLIIPTFLQPELAPNDVPVLIDPGKAFGTGMHPSTQLCLAAIEQYLRPGESILDIGCGSGILAIAALKLGAKLAAGFDSDPDAIRAARKNARANKVAKRLLLAQGSLAAIQRQANHQLVAVNILSRTIIRFLASGLTQTVATGGVLILGGILAEQEPEMRAALHAAGMALLSRKKASAKDSGAGSWVALIARAQ